MCSGNDAVSVDCIVALSVAVYSLPSNVAVPVSGLVTLPDSTADVVFVYVAATAAIATRTLRDALPIFTALNPLSGSLTLTPLRVTLPVLVTTKV